MSRAGVGEADPILALESRIKLILKIMRGQLVVMKKTTACFEMLHKHLAAGVAALAFTYEPAFTAHPLAKEAGGSVFVGLKDAVNAVCMNVQNSVIPELRTRHIELDRIIDTFEAASAEDIAELRKIHSSFAQRLENERRVSRESASIDCTFQKGARLHHINVDYLYKVGAAKKDIVNKIGYFIKTVTTHRSKQIDLISDFIGFVEKNTGVSPEYELKELNQTSPTGLENVMQDVEASFAMLTCIDPHYKQIDLHNAFFGRVIGAFTAKDEETELSVQRKETVAVNYISYTGWYHVTNRNGEQGLVPAGLIIPVE